MEFYSKLIQLSKTGALLTVLLLLTSLASVGQTVVADSVKFPIGSKINLTIDLPFNQSEQVKWPQLRDTITKSIEILSKSDIDTVTIEATNKKILRQIVGITSFDTGFIVLPPFKFEISKQGTPPAIAATEPLLLQVYKLKIDPKADIRDIKPIYKAPITFKEILPWIALALAIGLITYAILYFMKRRKTEPAMQPVPKVKVPAWEIALKKLDTLKSEQLWEKGNVKEYYTQLTDILREYFELTYNVNASEMTSTEIQEAIAPHVNDDKVMTPLRNVLFLSDMAKFAKAQPGNYENEQSIIYGTEIVNLIKLKVIGSDNQSVKQ